MPDKTILAGVLMDEHTTISFIEVCEKCNISEEALLEMLEYGVANHQEQKKKAHFDEKAFSRIQSACRLQQDLEINLPGVALVLDLLDELEQVRKELQILQRHMDR